MSIGNLKDNGNKGNNFPYQLATLRQLKLIEDAIITSGGTDRELRVTTYEAIAAGIGYSIGDTISRTDIIDVATSTIIGTIWFNETTGFAIAAPIQADLIVSSGSGSVTVLNPFNLETTQLAIEALLTPTARTPSLIRSSVSGTIAAGARSVSVFNAGLSDGMWLGAVIKPGEQLSYSADGQGDTFTSFTYDGTGTDLVITKVV